MAIEGLSKERLGPGRWRLTWTGTSGGPYYLFLNGEFLGTTDVAEYEVWVQGDEQWYFEVFDSAESVPEAGWPGYAVIHWTPAEGAAHYRVDRLVGGDWDEVARIPEDGRGTFEYRTAKLEDCSVHEFRVMVVDDAGLEGVAREARVEMVRWPDAPSVAVEYDSATGCLTIG